MTAATPDPPDTCHHNNPCTPLDLLLGWDLASQICKGRTLGIPRRRARRIGARPGRSSTSHRRTDHSSPDHSNPHPFDSAIGRCRLVQMRTRGEADGSVEVEGLCGSEPVALRRRRPPVVVLERVPCARHARPRPPVQNRIIRDEDRSSRAGCQDCGCVSGGLDDGAGDAPAAGVAGRDGAVVCAGAELGRAHLRSHGLRICATTASVQMCTCKK